MIKGFLDAFRGENLQAAGVSHGRSDLPQILESGRLDFAQRLVVEFEKTDVLIKTGRHLIRGNKANGKITIEPIPE